MLRSTHSEAVEMMDQNRGNTDEELASRLKDLAGQDRLTDYLTDLLAAADRPQFDIGGAAVALMASDDPPINDKSCYKACLHEDIRNPGSYAACIKKCRPKASLTLEVFASVN
jgi:hypothetical protein